MGQRTKERAFAKEIGPEEFEIPVLVVLAVAEIISVALLVQEKDILVKKCETGKRFPH